MKCGVQCVRDGVGLDGIPSLTLCVARMSGKEWGCGELGLSLCNVLDGRRREALNELQLSLSCTFALLNLTLPRAFPRIPFDENLSALALLVCERGGIIDEQLAQPFVLI